MTSAITSPSIYPVYCHELSPTIGKWCPLRAVDVHRLRSVGMILDGKLLYHHENHPIKWVRVTGVIVAIDEFYQRRVYTVDDSSGECIECTCLIPPPPPQTLLSIPVPPNLVQAKNERKGKQEELDKSKNVAIARDYLKIPEEIDIGSVVKIKGLVTEFRNTKQIDMRSIVLTKGTDEEVRCWNEGLEFRRDVLSQPWVVEPVLEEKMRRRSMRLKRTERRPRDGQTTDLRRKALESKKSSKEAISLGEMEGTTDRQTTDFRKKTSEYKKPTKELKLLPKDDGATGGQPGKRTERYGQRLTEEELSLLSDRKRRERDERGLRPENRANYPSLAVRNSVAGKYDALGI
ncbi:DnaJ domain-containing protein [Phlyctema vagabunda]|uniref:DnaJ domain-containing protein n=1 Tax=Phlyctema vagabunda TaxID=108571 RepID=A0ABR4PKJ7_9HELO